jgi:hypothetical protein
VEFRIRGIVTGVETFAVGSAIREHQRLLRFYGKGRWRKRKGVAMVELPGGALRRAEIHWYEATGIGRKEYKIKRYLDD